MSDGPVYATRKFTFSAAHRYGRPEWSESENRRVFGHLTVSHGHNYVLEVTGDAAQGLAAREEALAG